MASSQPTPVRSPPSLVTPFTTPATCRNLFTSTTSVQTVRYDTTTRMTTIYSLGPKTDDPAYSACEPAGWDVATRFFSPGFCPEDQTYHQVTATRSSSTRITQAFCCPPMFTPAYSYKGVICQVQTYMGRSYETLSVFNMPALTVQWQDKDTSLATAAIPKLTAGSFLRTWDPYVDKPYTYSYNYDDDDDYYRSTTTRYGYYTSSRSWPSRTAGSGVYTTSEPDTIGSGDMDAKTRAVVIAVPVVVAVLLLLGLVGGIVGYKRSQRRAALLEKMAPEDSESGDVAAEANIAQPAPAVVNQRS